MTRTIFSTGILAAALITGGCATKKYVQQTTTPIQAKVDQVDQTTQKQGQGSRRLKATSNKWTKKPKTALTPPAPRKRQL